MTARATITLPAVGRIPQETVTLNRERTAFFRGVAAALECDSIQEAFDRYTRRPFRPIGTIL